ncbi:MAG: methylenetetrahydrofolate reductase C-terminal domain-containing protein [Hyphomicrobiales bacterium]|nr:methylenetetrahydrofolate reductase C-terminal domain-containing protein [Hyphomicrobiales bacterium]
MRPTAPAKSRRRPLPRITAYEPAGAGPVRRLRSPFTIRQWSVRHARFLERLYTFFADILLGLHPLWRALGYGRVERPVKSVEQVVKGFLFDCRMCGQCVLSDTGMSCPMNCPKGLRNGPCGGVRANGNCEVEPDMPCVWVEAWSGSRQMAGGDHIQNVQPPLRQSLRGTSSWLRATAERAAREEAARAGGADAP